jgi:DNA-directed RNA polymerase subunit RPC12/RpoP
MARRYPCPQCAREMLLEKIHEGFTVPCPACGHRFLVPAGATDDPEGAVPPLAPRRPDGAATPGTEDGTGAFVVGLIGITVCSLLGPVAWYMGHDVRQKAVRAGREPPGLATAGWILGIVTTILLGLAAVAGIVILLVVMGNKL